MGFVCLIYQIPLLPCQETSCSLQCAKDQGNVLVALPWAVIEPSMDFTILKSPTKPLSAQPGDTPRSLPCSVPDQGWFLLLL